MGTNRKFDDSVALKTIENTHNDKRDNVRGNVVI